MEEDKEIEIDITKKYDLPPYDIKEFRGQFLVIFPLIAKWLVFNNNVQLDFFKRLTKVSIKEAIKNSGVSEDDIEWVLVQIEGKKICGTNPFEKSIDKSIHLYLTNACNLRCSHCYMNAGARYEHELTTDEIFRIIRTFSKEGRGKIVLSGGEVLMRKDFIPIIKECSNNGLTIEVLTNGTLWNRTILNEVAEYIHKIQISIDGFNEEENAKVRGKGSFQKSLDTIKLLSEYDILVEIAVTPFYDATLKNKITDYASFGRKLLKEYPKTVSAVKFTGEIFDGRDRKFTKREKDEYLHIAQEIYKQCYNESGDEAFVEYHKKGGKEGNCNYGNLAIDAEGNIYFCPAVNLMRPFGNIRDVNLTKLFQNVRRIQQKSHVDNIEPCKSCDLRYICGGECRAIHFSLFSDCKLTYLNEDAGKRICMPQTREYYYEMMVRTNEMTLE